MNQNIFRTYDIRGIADAQNPKDIDLTEESIYLIAKATGTYIQNKYKVKSMVVGRDCRLTSLNLQKAYIKGLRETGVNITNIGLSTSPMVSWAICKYGFDAGANITASHNPKNYNGIKLSRTNADSIHGEELQEIYKLTKSQKFIETDTPGTLVQKEVWPDYRKDLTSKIKLERPIKVVLDSANGVAGPFIGDLFRTIGAEVIELFAEPDGTFPNHEADPSKSKNQKFLSDKVLETSADIGFGFDGDADRIGVVDEKGFAHSSETALLLLTQDLASRHDKPLVIFDTKFSQAVINEIKKTGVETLMYKTGHSLIKAKMKETGALLTGEVSGHIFFAENYYGFDDAFLAAIKITEILSKSKNSYSSFFNNIEKTFTTEELKAHCPDDKKFKVVEKIVKHFTQNYNCITVDGVRIQFDELSWALVRCSNTSPSLVLRFEAKSPEQLRDIQTIIYDQLVKFKEVDNSWYKN